MKAAAIVVLVLLSLALALLQMLGFSMLVDWWRRRK